MDDRFILEDDPGIEAAIEARMKRIREIRIRAAADRVRQEGTNQLGASIRIRRLNRRMSQKDLADLIGTDRGTICNWELCRYSPNAYWMPLLADALGCTIEDLFLPAKASVPEK